MLCEICHENEARVTYTEIINGVKKEQHLCENCAAKQPPFSLIGKGVPEIQFGNILSGLLQSFAKGLDSMQQKESICGRCGMTASEFTKNGKLGCPDCYNAFAPILDKNLKTVQGAVDNKAKRPLNAVYFEPVKRNGAAQGGNNPGGINGGNEEGREPETGSVLGTAGTMEEILGTAPKREKKGTVKKKAPARKRESTAAVKKEKASGKDNDEITVLRRKMEQAVKKEDYEEAARLRDMIHALEGK